ncbi:MAG: class I poly(R)-hydroxyalkanoic acid synthase, partial [Hyphomicrobiales bacterium]
VKYQHWIGSADKPASSLEAWIEAAEERPGSWWPDWAKWLERYSGDRIPASGRIPGKGPYPVIEDAPGSYVRTRSA